MNHLAIIQLTFLFLQVLPPEFPSRFRFVPAGALLSIELVPSVEMYCSSALSLGAFNLACFTSANQAIQKLQTICLTFGI